MTRVGILGSGDVGKALAKGFLKHGYDVVIGSDHPEKLAEFMKENPKMDSTTLEQASRSGDIIVLCVKGTAAEEIIEKVKRNLSGKILIDTTNPIADGPPPQNGVLNFFTTLENSLMERLQKIAPDAHFVKAFNSIGSAFMVNPDFGYNTKPTMFICGNDVDAKRRVSEILEKFGFEVEDMGRVESARAIEPLCILWCIPGFLRNEWAHAFKLLKR